MQSPNFEAYSSAGERDTRDTLRYFERVRDFFLQVNKSAPQKSVPVRIVVFGSEKEYAPYRPNEFATAYYFGGSGRDYIVIGRSGEQTAQLAVHEYVHLVARHAGLNFPPWLNEGIAELYSTLRMQGDKVLVGELIPGRIQALSRERWVPLATILSAGPDSPYYSEKDKAGSLYNEGWALAHMLQLSPQYFSKYSEFANALVNGLDSAAAFEKVYGKTVSAVEKDLRDYTSGFQFYGSLFPVKLVNAKESFPISPAGMFDVRLALADLANRPGKDAEARKAFEDLAREDPKRPEPWAGLGNLEWRRNRIAEAVEAFGKAYELGERSPDFLWDFGRLTEGVRPEAAVGAFTDLLKQEPERLDARLELGALHLNSRRPGQALAVLAGVTKVPAEQASRFFTMLADAQIRLGDRDGARVTIAKLAANMKTPEERRRVEQMQRYLEQPDLPRPDPPLVALTGERAPRSVIEGSFVEFVCLDEGFKVVIETGQGKKGFLFTNPKQVSVAGRGGKNVDLSCGPQPPTHVKIEYTAAGAGTDADGILTILYLDPEIRSAPE